jgi:hypothetical protein
MRSDCATNKVGTSVSRRLITDPYLMPGGVCFRLREDVSITRMCVGGEIYALESGCLDKLTKIIPVRSQNSRVQSSQYLYQVSSSSNLGLN